MSFGPTGTWDNIAVTKSLCEISIMHRFSVLRMHPVSVNDVTSLLAALVLLAAFADQARAQAQKEPNAIETIGTCVAIQTNVTTVETPIGLQAEGSCEASADERHLSCTVEIVPTGPGIILDVNDNTGVPRCDRLSGDDPCASMQNGPLIFQSDRRATQSFSAYTDRVRVTTRVRQLKVQQTFVDLPPSARFPLVGGRLFDVLRNHSSASARLECSMADGDQRIYPIVGEADLSPNIRFVSKNSSEPSFDILTYRPTP